MSAGVTIRPCVAGDEKVILDLVLELAAYERLESEVTATPEAVREHLFGPRPSAEAVFAESDGEVIGFALYFGTFSTFKGRAGLYLEDLFVRPAYRGRGVGKALLSAVARVAVDRGCGRLEWSVLDWNAPAIEFYLAAGARPMVDWSVYRVVDSSLERLAGGLAFPPNQEGRRG